MLSHISNRPRVAYLVLVTLMSNDVGQIFLTGSLHRDHSTLYALVCEKELSYMGKNNGNPDLVREKKNRCELCLQTCMHSYPVSLSSLRKAQKIIRAIATLSLHP